MMKSGDMGKKGHFWTFLRQTGPKSSSAQKKRTCYKVLEKNTNGFQEKCVTDRRMDGSEFIEPCWHCQACKNE